METALQELIKENQIEFDKCLAEFNKATSDMARMEYSARMSAISQSNNRIKAKLPKERENIVDAFDHGQANHCPPTEFLDGKEYFITLYGRI
jgi:hypothetical protein